MGERGGSPGEGPFILESGLKGLRCAMLVREVFISPLNDFIMHVAPQQREHGFRARGEEETFTRVSGVLGKAVGRYSAASHMGGGPLV